MTFYESQFFKSCPKKLTNLWVSICWRTCQTYIAQEYRIMVNLRPAAACTIRSLSSNQGMQCFLYYTTTPSAVMKRSLIGLVTHDHYVYILLFLSCTNAFLAFLQYLKIWVQYIWCMSLKYVYFLFLSFFGTACCLKNDDKPGCAWVAWRYKWDYRDNV